jgi:carbon starvation protein CstA
MYTFIIGICILFGGGIAYAFVLRRVFGINQNHKTIAFTKRDNVDYVPMNKFRNAAIQLKSIAGTGPILGPIQGILFGPIAFLTIPIGNILGGITHDTYSGLMSMRNGGAQMPDLLKRYIGKICQIIFLIMACIVALLVSALFLSMPGTIISGSIAHKAGPGTNTPYTSS